MATIPSIAVIPSGYKASKLYSVLPTDGSGDLDVVRAGLPPNFNATRVNQEGLIENVLSNVPRLDYSDGGCPSLLVEPQRTNLATYSEDFANASYFKDNLTITSNVVNSPSGTLTADLLLPNSNNVTHYLYKTNTVTSATVYNFSVFVKKAGYNFVRLSFSGGTVSGGTPIFDLNLGTVVSGAGTITPFIDGWYKISVTITTTSTTLLSLIAVRESSGVSDFIGDTVSGVYAWGAQLEAGSNASSYIPTVASTVTRNADDISKTGISSLINSPAGVFFNEVVLESLTLSADRHLILRGDASNYVNVYFNTLGNIVARIQVAGVSTFLSTPITQVLNKVAILWQSNKYALFVNGVKTNENLTGATFPAGTLNKIDFDNVNSNTPFYGEVKQTIVFTTALTDLELETLTTL